VQYSEEGRFYIVIVTWAGYWRREERGGGGGGGRGRGEMWGAKIKRGS